MESYPGKVEQTAKEVWWTRSLKSRFVLASYCLNGKMRLNGLGLLKKEGPAATASKETVTTFLLPYIFNSFTDMKNSLHQTCLRRVWPCKTFLVFNFEKPNRILLSSHYLLTCRIKFYWMHISLNTCYISDNLLPSSKNNLNFS